ncbi:hypothetical protein KFU94_18700 [Chloroflexi bacterium TSY]|nr:hypothetical protein [Chloroflexi bacterium TSY]
MQAKAGMAEHMDVDVEIENNGSTVPGFVVQKVRKQPVATTDMFQGRSFG